MKSRIVKHQGPWVIAVVLLAGLVDAKCADSGNGGMSGSRPNVVFFLGDDQSRFDHSAYGNPTVPTPTTDALSKESLVFDKAFTGQAICAPSRSMLYTGLYPLRNGCFINHTKIRAGVKTLPVYLEELGYNVILAGKSHVGPAAQFSWSKSFPPVENEGASRPGIPLDEIDGFLADPGTKPFCLLITSEFPHPPYMKSTPYTADDVTLAPFISKSERSLKNAAFFYANIVEKEKELAAVLKLLEEHEQKDKSIVFYADDHGLFRGKFTAYDSGLNVAFMVRWPEKVKAGRSDALVSFADFVPTMIELAGGNPPQELDGKSLLPILENGGGKIHDYVYGVTVNQGILDRHVFPQRSVHDGRYHYIHNFNSLERIKRDESEGKEIHPFLKMGAEKHKDLPEEMLFDTQSDPHEMNNLAGDPKLTEIKQRLKSELFRWMREQNDYLTESGSVPFLQVGKRFALDQYDAELNPIPKGLVGCLKGKTINPHDATAPKADR
ncbi:sulfatase [Haloferula chungangensis]|uniref:Sulfatase n=1 Tax=Haloferula chungangensis TaxID=1048331 RepID=A0ABW2L378_9BACT